MINLLSRSMAALSGKILDKPVVEEKYGALEKQNRS